MQALPKGSFSSKFPVVLVKAWVHDPNLRKVLQCNDAGQIGRDHGVFMGDVRHLPDGATRCQLTKDDGFLLETNGIPGDAIRAKRTCDHKGANSGALLNAVYKIEFPQVGGRVWVDIAIVSVLIRIPTSKS